MKYERMTKYEKLTNEYWVKATRQEVIDSLAELENKIEQGTLIELPCKVGDTVYVIIKAENGYALLKDICD